MRRTKAETCGSSLENFLLRRAKLFPPKGKKAIQKDGRSHSERNGKTIPMDGKKHSEGEKAFPRGREMPA